MKKFISLVLILLINFVMIEPVLAEESEYSEQDTPVFSTAIDEEKVFLSP